LRGSRSKVRYADDVERAIERISAILSRDPSLISAYSPRWLSIKLLENDEDALNRLRSSPVYEEAVKVAEEERLKLFKRHEIEAEILLANERYRVIGEIVKAVAKGAKKVTVSDLIDKVILDKRLGIPIFFTVIWMMFQFTMSVSAPFCDMLGDLFAWISGSLSGLTGIEAIDALFFGDYGVVNGIGTVLSFVPLIFFLYFALSILEDSGYMARAAFVMDRAMRKLGLTGRTIIPMIIGFGCNVPAIYATRTIPNEEDRLVAIITNPLMLCSARLTVFSMLAYAFFRTMAGSVIVSLYVMGIALAFVVALLFRKLYLKGRVSPFIMELPPYQSPTLRSVFTHAYERGVMFFKKAGTVILLGLIVIEILMHVQYPSLVWGNDVEGSLVASLGKGLEPIFRPLGWDWRLAVSAFFGFVAKEIVLGSTALLYGVPEPELGPKLMGLYTPLQAYSYMVFILIYVPCIVTVAAIAHERGWKWALFTVAYGIVLAYLVSLAVFGFGTLIYG